MQVFFNIISMRWMPWRRPAAEFLPSKPSVTAPTWWCCFSDSGPGIKEPHRVFDPFYIDEARWERHRSGSQHLLRHHPGTRRKDSLLQPPGRRRKFSRVELPAVLAAFRAKELQLTNASANPAKPS